MERLYELLHETSRATGRAGILKQDLELPDHRTTMTAQTRHRRRRA